MIQQTCLLLSAILLLLFNCNSNPANRTTHTIIPATKKGIATAEADKLETYCKTAKSFCRKNHYNNIVCFLVDMSLPSGSNRFFVYDIGADSVVASLLVAHGSCNTAFARDAVFSNEAGCGCSAAGRYRIGKKYQGRFGTAYKLHGLDSSNDNAFRRNIVLHRYTEVPVAETAPLPICNSLGCPMVSPASLTMLSKKIDGSNKPVLLWIFN